MWEVMPHFMKDVCPLFNYTICVILWYIFILKHCHCGLQKYNFSEWYHSVSWQWEKCKDVCKLWQSIPLTGHKDEHCGDLRRSVMMLTTREMEVPTLLLIIVQTVAELQSTSTMSPLFGTSTNCTKMVNGDYNCYDDQRYKWLQCCLHKMRWCWLIIKLLTW